LEVDVRLGVSGTFHHTRFVYRLIQNYKPLYKLTDTKFYTEVTTDRFKLINIKRIIVISVTSVNEDRFIVNCGRIDSAVEYYKVALNILCVTSL